MSLVIPTRRAMLYTPTVAVAAGGPVAITQTDNGLSATDSNTYTFTNRALGSAQADRRIIVGLCMRVAGTTTTVSSVTVGGVSASSVIDVPNNGGGNTTLGALYIADVPSGTTGDVVVTFSGTVLRCGVNVWRMVGAASGTASSTGSTQLDNTGVSVTVPANGSAVGYAVTDATSVPTMTWTNITASLGVTSIESSFYHAGSMIDSVGGGAITFTADWLGGTISTPVSVYAAWAP